MAIVKKIGAEYVVMVGSKIVFRSLTRAHAVAHAEKWNINEEVEGFVWKQTSLTLAAAAARHLDARLNGVNDLGQPIVEALVRK